MESKVKQKEDVSDHSETEESPEQDAEISEEEEEVNVSFKDLVS